jgi:hypothetical protein
MKTQNSETNPSTTATGTPDFSLVLGGPLYQFFQRAYLSGTGLELLHRRMIFIPLLLWLPALFLSVMDGYTTSIFRRMMRSGKPSEDPSI